MEIAVKTNFLGFNPQVLAQRTTAHVLVQVISPERTLFSLKVGGNAQRTHKRKNARHYHAFKALATEHIEARSQFEHFSVACSCTSEAEKLKLSVKVSGGKTEAIFDNEFNKMVADAQPIPGFRRVKGGKTPDIPRDILLQVLGPSKVYKQVIKKVINYTIAEYIEKEDLTVSKDLRVEQSFEDLEAMFEPGEPFSFDAVVECQN